MSPKVDTSAITHLKDLRPDPRNARKHTPRNVGSIVSALHEVGAARSIVIDEDGTVLAGNATIEAAAEAGITRVQVVDADGETVVAVRRSGLTPEQKTRLALYDNRAAELAEWDTEVLRGLADEGALAGMFSEDELAALLETGEAKDGLTDPDAVPDERATSIVAGDLFSLGKHLLLCGDTTEVEDIARVMTTHKAALLVTDPPYGVSYADKNRFLNEVAPANRIQEPIANDHMKPEDMSALWTTAFSTVRLFMGDGAAYYVTGPQGGDLLLLLLLALRESGFPLRHMLVWAKNNHVLGRCDYHYKHEPIVYGWVDGSHKFYGGRSEFSLWEIDKPHKSDLHPTMKPVELYTRAIQNSSAADDVVVEPFSGSGTSLIACEQLSRVCHAIEIEPRYVQVAIDRWEQFTGSKATKVGEAVRA